MVFAPTPQIGQLADCELDGIAIKVKPGTYVVAEPQRFGEKVSQGDLKYADFNPFESAISISSLAGGAGLLRYSDAPDENTVIRRYKEASGVNASASPIILAPQQSLETLPGSNGTPVWVGEFVPSTGALAGARQWVAIAGTKVFTRNAAGTGVWADTGIALPAVPLKSAIGVFGGTLIIGFGAAITARSTTDLATLGNVQNTTPANLFVWAVTTDRAASYIAGGPLATNSNQVLSSTAAASGYAGPVQCGSPDSAITSLSPGGGLVTLFVGKDRELGEIDNQGIYRSLIPFDSYLPTNCNPMRWGQGSGGEAQRGPVSLVFARERSLWQFQPDSQTSGSSANISPWNLPYLRPPNSRGIVTAIQGTARWMYFAVTSRAGRSWIWRRDAVTSAPHTYLDLGTNACQAIGISQTTSLTGNPVLYVGTGNNITSIILPLDGEDETNDPNCRFASSGYIDLADIDLGFPDEDKIAYSVRVVSDNVLAGAQTVDVQAAPDGAALLDLGVDTTPPAQTIEFAGTTVGKRLSVRLVLTTNDPTKTPKIWAVSVRVSINPTLFRTISFQGVVASGGSFFTLADDLQNPKAIRDKLWSDRAAGLPVPFTDIWNEGYTVRILKLTETYGPREPDRPPEILIDTQLLIWHGPNRLAPNVYDAPTMLYDLPTSVYG